MKTIFSVLLCASALWIAAARADSNTAIAEELVALEREAMEGWLAGDPSPQLAILAPAITYIHEASGKRLDGLPAVRELYEPYRGRPLFDSYEILSPKVVEAGDVAILTYQLAQHVGATTKYWNATQVYRKTGEGWRTIHSHWSAATERQP
jgi:hypothetical protein